MFCVRLAYSVEWNDNGPPDLEFWSVPNVQPEVLQSVCTSAAQANSNPEQFKFDSSETPQVSWHLNYTKQLLSCLSHKYTWI